MWCHWTEFLSVTGCTGLRSCVSLAPVVVSLAVGGRVSVVCCTQAFIFNYGAITIGRNVPSLSVSLESHYHLLCLHESLMWSWAWQGLVNVTSLSLSVSLDKATCVILVTIASHCVFCQWIIVVTEWYHSCLLQLLGWHCDANEFPLPWWDIIMMLFVTIVLLFYLSR